MTDRSARPSRPSQAFLYTNPRPRSKHNPRVAGTTGQRRVVSAFQELRVEQVQSTSLESTSGVLVRGRERIAIGAQIGRLRPRILRSHFTRLSCVVPRGAP